MRSRPRPKFAVIAALVAAMAAAAVAQVADAPKRPKKQARLYEEALRGMMGQPFGKVISAIEDWKFQILASWEAVNPTAKFVAKHNRNKIRFSKREIAEIFGPGGAFRVVVYDKLVGRDSTTLGTVDGSGMSTTKDLTMNLEKFTVVRAVFKDNALVLFQVWPIVDQSSLAGGTLLYR